MMSMLMAIMVETHRATHARTGLEPPINQI